MMLCRPTWLPSESELAKNFARVSRYLYYRLQLTEYVARLLPERGPCTILDVGAGDGSLGAVFAHHRPQTTVVGIETSIRERKWSIGDIPMVCFDGARLPFPDDAFDCALLSNVLHHVGDTRAQSYVLQEVQRVTRCRIIVKDHIARHSLDRGKLAVLDVIGNRRFGASTTGHYQNEQQWASILANLQAHALKRYDALSFRTGLLERVFGNELEIMFTIDFA